MSEAAEVSDATFGEIERSNFQLQNMLGEALGEVQYLKESRALGYKAMKTLQRKACLAAFEAERFVNKSAKQAKNSARHVENQMLVHDFKLTEAQLEVHQWKRRAAVLQLKFDSLGEDMHQADIHRKHLLAEFGLQDQQLKDTNKQCGSLKVQLEQCRAALVAAEAKFQSAVSTAGTTQAAVEQQLHDARGELSLLRDQLRQASARGDAAAGQADALQQKTEAAESRAAKAEIRVAALEAAAGERSKMLDVLSKERQAAADDKVSNLEQHFARQIKDLKDALASEQRERNDREELWRKKLDAAQQQCATLTREVQAKDFKITRLKAGNSARGGSEEPEEAVDREETAMGLVSSMVDQLCTFSPPNHAAALLPSLPLSQPRRAEALARTETNESQPALGQLDPESTGNADLDAGDSTQQLGLDALDTDGKIQEEPAAKKTAKPAAAKKQKKGASKGTAADKAGAAKSRRQAEKQRSEATAAEAVVAAPKRTGGDEETSCSQIEDGADESDAPKSANAGPRRMGRSRKPSQPYWMGSADSSALPSPADEQDPPYLAEDDEQPIARPAENGTEAGPNAAMAGARPADQLMEESIEEGETELQEPPVQENAAGAKRRAKGAGNPGAGKRSRLGIASKAAGASEELQNAAPETERPAVEETAEKSGADAAVAGDCEKRPSRDDGVAEQRANDRKSGRPLGVSKIDLSTVWGSRTSASQTKDDSQKGEGVSVEMQDNLQSQQEASQPDKENEDKQAGAPKPGEKLEGNPLAALNPKVLKAAADRRKGSKTQVSAQLGTRRSQLHKAPQADGSSKRKLQPPSYLIESLPRDLLFGPSGTFKVPQLKKPQQAGGASAK